MEKQDKTSEPEMTVKAEMTAESDEKKPGFTLLRFTLMLFAIAIAHFATAVSFGHSVTNVLGTLAEDTVMLNVVVAVVAYIRSRMRRKGQR
ncbi:hypothetical protein ACFV2H_39915 [Streptomyces sp. NPDC059629]|uniref:hypothetical protein n=1 Tax=Streptomyces sp. NPDC059629 TaxID=3346889 RepID=UPI00369F5858